jgi:hypothetical protein
MFRRWPEARAAFVGRGSWITKRFGLPWIVGFLIAPFAWLFGGTKLVPNTEIGAWLLFGPALISLVVGVGLGALRIMRAIADE